MSTTPEDELRLGKLVIRTPQTTHKRISMLLWGQAGCGKTTLAATAPGKKLWINFDPDGTDSLTHHKDILVADFSGLDVTTVDAFKSDNPYDLARFIDNNNVDTVVVDSLSAFADAALRFAVSQCKNSTIERPGLQAYGMRNSYVYEMVCTILRITRKKDKHAIFIAHEASPDKNDDGIVVLIAIALGGQLTNMVPRQLSEVWSLEDTGKERRIAIRPCRSRRPMKSRIFDSSESPEFVWRYNPETGKGEGIAQWFNQWVESGCEKIPLPQQKQITKPK